MQPIITFLKDHILLEDKEEANELRRKAAHYISKTNCFIKEASHHRSYDAPEEKRPLMFFVRFTKEFMATILRV